MFWICLRSCCHCRSWTCIVIAYFSPIFCPERRIIFISFLLSSAIFHPNPRLHKFNYSLSTLVNDEDVPRSYPRMLSRHDRIIQIQLPPILLPQTQLNIHRCHIPQYGTVNELGKIDQWWSFMSKDKQYERSYEYPWSADCSFNEKIAAINRKSSTVTESRNI